MSESEFEKFKKTWETQIANIKDEAIDGDGVRMIRLRFELSVGNLQIYTPMSKLPDSIYTDLDLLESQLDVALEIAHSRFRLRNRGILARVFAGIADKIPKKLP
jgi:hypothetical protein